MDALLAPVRGALEALGARAEVAEFEQVSGRVVIRFEGVETLRYGVEDAVRGDARVRSVEFVSY